MSFMNRIGNQFEGLGLGNKNGVQERPYYYQAPPAVQPPSYGYQQPPNPFSQAALPPTQYYAATPPAPPQPPYQTPSTPDRPTLPPGWTTLFDQQQQRWYYVEQSTNRTQWEVPTANSPPPPDTRPSDMSRGTYSPAPQNAAYGQVGYPSQQPPVSSPPAQGDYPPPGQIARYPPAQPGYSPQPAPQQMQTASAAAPEAKKSGRSGILLGATSGLAVGAAGTVLVGGAMRSHEERYEEAYEEGVAENQHGYGGDDGDDDY